MKNKKLIIGIAIAVVVAIIATVAVVLVVTGDDDKDSRKKKKSDKETVEQEAPQVDSGNVVATCGDYEVTAGEYSYFYMSLYKQAEATASMYDQYYPGMGAQYFDYTKDPAEQTCQEGNLPEGVVTWADYFSYCAPERAVLVKMLCDEAVAAEKDGFKISDKEKAALQASIDETIDAYRQQADSQDYKLDNYLEKTFGAYVTEALFRELLEKEYVAELYLAWYQETAASNIKDADVEAYYNDHKADLDIVAIRVFGISYASGYTADEARERAESFVEDLNSGKSFAELAIEYSPEAQKSSYENDSATLMNYQTKGDLESIYTGLGEWAFEDGRRASDTFIMNLASANAYFVIAIEAPATRNVTPTSVAVRHILIEVAKTTTADDGSTVGLPAEIIELNKTNARAKVDEILEKLAEKGNTEEAFIELVATYTNDPGSISNGGLYDNINYQTNFVTEFLDWSIAPHNEGDIEVIETTYGYHVMYYVGGDTTPVWKSEIRATLGAEAYEGYYATLAEDIRNNIERSEDDIDEVREKAENIVALMVQENAAYASMTSYY